MSFVRTFEEFCLSQAFKNAAGGSTERPFDGYVFLRMVKILFEGQTRKSSAMLALKAIFPPEFSHAKFTNYLEIYSEFIDQDDLNLLNQYQQVDSVSPSKARFKDVASCNN